MIQSSNFDFLQATYRTLWQTGRLAEQYYHLDRNGCVAKLRLFAEQCTALLMVHYQCAPHDYQENLNERLNRLSFETSMPSYLIELLHQLRSAGNWATHAQSDYDQGQIAKNQARDLLKSAHELAEFIWVTLAHKQGPLPVWQEPVDPGASYLYQLAFEGDCEACFALAEQLNKALQEAYREHGGQLSQAAQKQRQQLQEDVDYWLTKSLRQAHWPSQLLAARIASGQLNTPAEPAKAEQHFLQALESDEPQVRFYYALFLQAQEKGNKWLKLMHRAASQGLLAATEALICYYDEQHQQDDYRECVTLGMAQNLSLAYALRLLALDPETDAKEGRQLMIRAHASSDKALIFARGYGLYGGYFGYPQNRELGYQLMRDNYQALPPLSCINSAYLTFIYGDGLEWQTSQRVSLAEQAIKRSIGQANEAEIAYQVAIWLMKHIADNGRYQGCLVPKVLLKRAQELGHTAAQRFVNSLEGRSQLAGMVNVGRPKVDRKKQSDKRKASKKARKRR
ncbi:MAG: DUF4145 domain-containing protein [Ferrimonas sp.]